jgi:hypothetical protein
MSTLTVIVAPPGPLAGVRDCLTDWSSAGLVDDFLWVEPSMVSPDNILALSIKDGRSEAVRLQTLAGTEQFERIRLAVLVPALSAAPPMDGDVEQEIARFFEASFANTPVIRVRAILVRGGDSTRNRGLVVEGWHNIVLSPEDAVGPGFGSTELRSTSDPIDLGVHAAANLAGLLALWRGIDASVLDTDSIFPGMVVRLSRSFFRHVSTRQIETDLRGRTLSIDRGLPLPMQLGSTALYIDDVSLATGTMADQLWARHAAMLVGPRETADRALIRRIGPLEALRMFLGFLGAAIRNAPRAWVVGTMNKVKAQAASTVHHLVFGSAPSAYAVVVKGVTADGTPASWLDLRDATAVLEKVLDDRSQAREHVLHEDLSGLWEDYVSAALTLSDGGQRVAALAPVQIGLQVGVLRSVALAVPAADSAFDAVPPHLAASIGIATAAPYDVLGVFAIEERLRAASQAPATGLPASTALQALGDWKAKHFDSFAASVGTRIGVAFASVNAEIRGYLEQFQRAAELDDIVSGIQTKQKRLARVLQVLSIVFVAIIVVVVALFLTSVIGLVVLVITAIGALIAWLISSFIVFIRGQRELFALINARRTLLSEDELARRNLKHALREATRLSDCYSQFLAWSSILGAFLAAPFGRTKDSSNVKERALVGLPMGVRLGTASAPEPDLAVAALELQHDTFSVGWLSGCWDATVAAAHTQIGPRGIELRNDSRAIFRERADGEGSLLELWVDGIARDGADPSIGDRAWTKMLSSLLGDRRAVADLLLDRVGDPLSVATAAIPLEQFMGGVDSADHRGHERLVDVMLSDGARSRGSSQVDRSVSAGAQDGLGRTVSLTQLSAGIPAYELLAYLDSGEGNSDGDRVMPELFDGRPF